MNAPRQVVVGVLADEGLPEQVITAIADDLPAIFAARVSGKTRWRVEHQGEQLPLDEDGDIPMRALSQRHRQDQGWDLLVLITDLPRRAGTKPVVAGIDVEHGVAMISLPALGAVLVRHRAQVLLIRVVRQLVSRLGIDGDHGRRGAAARLREALAPTQRMSGGRRSSTTRLALIGLRGQARLLAGMVRDNRPWQLVPHLAGATVGGGRDRRLRCHHQFVLEARGRAVPSAAHTDHGGDRAGHGRVVDGVQPPVGPAFRGCRAA